MTREDELRFLNRFTSYPDECERAIQGELSYKGSLSSVGGEEEICDSVERDIMQSLPAGTWPWRWPWLPSAVWSFNAHRSYHVLFRDATRAAVLCLSLGTPLRLLDSSTRCIILHLIISCAAPTQSTDSTTDPWLPRLFDIPPGSLSNNRKRKWSSEKAFRMHSYVRFCTEGLRR